MAQYTAVQMHTPFFGSSHKLTKCDALTLIGLKVTGMPYAVGQGGYFIIIIEAASSYF